MKSLTTYRNIIADIRAKKFKPAYILHGEEAYFIDRISKEIEQNALEEHERDFNQTVLYGKDSTPDQIMECAKRFPMMAERNLVMLREAQSWKIDQFEKLESLFENPVATTVLVICYKHKKIDGRKKFVKEAKKKGVVFEGSKLYENEVPQWISGYVRQMERRIGEREAELLALHLGRDLAKIVSEVEKLCVVTEKGQSISADTIQQQIGISNDYNIFELQAAIGRGDRDKALRIAKYFGAAPSLHPLPPTISVLNTFLTKVALVHANPKAGRSDWPGILGVSPFFVRDYTQAAKQIPPAKVVSMQSHLRSCDAKSKGMGNHKLLKSHEILEEFVLRAMT